MAEPASPPARTATAAPVNRPLRRLRTPSGLADCLLVPTELVRLQTVHLPITGRQIRAQAAPFAMEDGLAEPVADLHVALGPEVAPQHYIAAVVRHSLMAEWVGAQREHGRVRQRIVPDVLTVPMPTAGGWAVLIDGDRALVRTDDGGGFAIAAAQLPIAWRVAGGPQVTSYGAALPEGIPAVAALAAAKAAAPANDRMAAMFDLRQGIYAPDRHSGWRSARAVALVALAGLIAHLGVLAYDVRLMGDLLAERRAEAAALLDSVAPASGAPGGDIAASLIALLPAEGTAGGAGFVPMLGAFAAALAERPGNLAITQLAFSRREGAMTATVETSDLAALQAAEALLAEAGLSPQAGTATVSDGAARATIRLREPGAAR